MSKSGDNYYTYPFAVLLVVLPMIFNAFVLLPELVEPVPSLNDDAFHYLLIQRASAAVAGGENPLDHWLPEAELGLPVFLEYQHLPHLAVVLLHRLLLKQVGLLTVFNFLRYVLLLAFPLTVYWSLRAMDFSIAAAAVAAAFSSLLSADHRYGFEYDSYVWRGLGTYTQIWGMHLFFISVACIQRLLTKGKGYVAATVACSMLVLSHLIYAFMAALTAIALFFLSIREDQA